MRRLGILMLTLVVFGSTVAHAQDLLSDANGDGTVSILAFGDSITFGIGDTHAPGEFVESAGPGNGIGGYPARLATYLGVPVTNSGSPGEIVVGDGDSRFAGTSPGSLVDLTIIMEGTNDSVFRTASSAVRVALQRMINVQIASGKETLLSTLAVPCCTHSSLAPYVDAYNMVIGELAEVNELALADIARTWRTSCPNPESCDLYNLPEGLHPNTKGYDAMAQTFAAALLDIDPYSSGGASDLAGAIGIPTEAIAIKPGV